MILHTELFKIVIESKFAHTNVKCDKNNTRKKEFDINMTKREWFVYDANYNQLAGSLDRGQSFICSPLFRRLHVNKKKCTPSFGRCFCWCLCHRHLDLLWFLFRCSDTGFISISTPWIHHIFTCAHITIGLCTRLHIAKSLRPLTF